MQMDEEGIGNRWNFLRTMIASHDLLMHCPFPTFLLVIRVPLCISNLSTFCRSFCSEFHSFPHLWSRFPLGEPLRSFSVENQIEFSIRCLCLSLIIFRSIMLSLLIEQRHSHFRLAHNLSVSALALTPRFLQYITFWLFGYICRPCPSTSISISSFHRFRLVDPSLFSTYIFAASRFHLIIFIRTFRLLI